MKKLSSFFSFIIKKMKHNWALKLLSLFFAIILWNSAVVQADPVRPVTYKGIPITVVGIEQFSEKDLALVESISSYATTAEVSLSINRSQISEFDESSISVQLDLSRVPSVGTHEIRLISTSPNVDKIIPESITVVVDERSDKIIPVECEVVGELPEGYHRSALSVSPNTIQVSGAKSIVEDIEKAYLRLDLTGRLESVSLSKEYTLIDSNGTALDASSLDVSLDSVVLDMDINPKKEVLISAHLLGEDKIADGYQVSDIVIEPVTIEITGDAELLEGLTSVKLEPIDITGQSENVLMPALKIVIPEGITLLGSEFASLLVEIEEKMSEASFELIDIELRNIPEGLVADEFVQQVNVKVIAPLTLIDNIVANHITLYVDMTGAEAGENMLPILYEAPEEYRVKNVEVSEETVTVVLK